VLLLRKRRLSLSCLKDLKSQCTDIFITGCQNAYCVCLRRLLYPSLRRHCLPFDKSTVLDTHPQMCEQSFTLHHSSCRAEFYQIIYGFSSFQLLIFLRLAKADNGAHCSHDILACTLWRCRQVQPARRHGTGLGVKQGWVSAFALLDCHIAFVDIQR